MDPFLLAALWAMWCALHSLLITPSVKHKIAAYWGDRMRYYRLLYNAVAIVTAAPLVYWGIACRRPSLLVWAGGLRLIQLVLLALAVYLFVAGARNYDAKTMLGLRQLQAGDDCTPPAEGCRLETGGILAVIRHPWYTGGIILLWARDMDAAALAVNIVLSAYLLLGAWLEERKLEAIYGDSYRRYRQQVSAFIPLKWIAGFGGKKDRRN